MITKFHPHLTQEKFNSFDQKKQSLLIASELARAKHWGIYEDSEKIKDSLNRAFELIDLAINCPNWRSQTKQLLNFREALASLYQNPPHSVIYELFYDRIIALSESPPPK